MDACDAVAKEKTDESTGNYAPARHPTQDRDRAGGDRDIDIDDGDEDGYGGYGGEGIVADDEY